MRVYLAAHAAKEHQRQFGWKNFRVLVVTTDRWRIETMIEALRQLRVPHSPGASLFLFATFSDHAQASPLAAAWQGGSTRSVQLI